MNKELFDSIKSQKFEDIIVIIENNKFIDINIKDESNTYFIYYCIIYNNMKLLKLLLKLDCKIDFLDNEGYSILYNPIKFGYNDVFNELIKNDNIGIPLVDIVDKHKYIPLNYAINYKNDYALKIIVPKSSNINHIDNYGYVPLHHAIKNKNYFAIEQLLEHPNININIQNKIGESALHIACNYENVKIIEMLLDKKININIADYENQITPLMYITSINNIEITKKLLNNGANAELQDSYGNTALHIAIQENNINIANLLMTNMNNFNLVDINSMTPLHLLLTLYNIDTILKYNIDILITKTNLNIQDFEGNNVWHILIKKKIWDNFKKLLINKKNNIFIKNKQNEMPIDLVNKSDYYDFINLIIYSYYNYIIINKNKEFLNKWENNCFKDIIICKKNIKNNIIKNNISVPYKKTSYCEIKIDIENKAYFTTFTGVSIDIIFGLLFLHQNNNLISTLNNNIMNNDELYKYYLQMGIQKNKNDFFNFEIVWLYQTIFYPVNFNNVINKFNNSNINFLIIPLGIELDIGAHANIIIINKIKKTIERFEPNGSDHPPNFNYNPKLLDYVLSNYFKTYVFLKEYKYIKPLDYIPKIGFQAYENIEYYKSKKIGDPGGFCVAWCLWYANYNIKYYEIDSKKLIIKLIKLIKYNNMSFKSIIRNFSKTITDFRDSFLNIVKIDINDYINEQYDDNVIIKLQELIHDYLKI